MAINFPDSPSTGQVFTFAGKNWIYNGTSWTGFSGSVSDATISTNLIVNGSVGINTSTSPSAKLEIKDGDIWLNGTQSSSNPEIRFIDDSPSEAGVYIRYGNSDGNLYLEHRWNNASSGFFFKNRTAGSAKTVLTLVDGKIGNNTTDPRNYISINRHYSPIGGGDLDRVLNWYSTTGGSEIWNSNIAQTITLNDSATGTQPNQIGLALANLNSADNTWSPAITFGGLSTSGSYINGSAAVAVKLINNAGDDNFKGGDLHFFTQGITASSRGLTSKLIIKNTGEIDVKQERLNFDTSANTNHANGITVYNTDRSGYLSIRVTTNSNSRGWGWEFSNNFATSSNAQATPYFRVSYDNKTIELANTTIAALPSGAASGSIAYVTDDSGQLYLKKSTGWVSLTARLGTATNPALSATAIINAGQSQGNGYYWIRPDGLNSFYVYCDMTTDGGGWMLMINARPNNGGQYYNNNDYGLSTVNGVTGVPEYNKSTTSMFGTTKINYFFKMSGFKYGRMTPGPGISVTAPYTGLYQRIGTSTTYYWMGTGFECSNLSNINNTNPWAVVQYKNWSDALSASNGRSGCYTGGSHYFPTTYCSGWQNFWKGDQDGLRFSSTFDGENYSSIGQNTSPGYWWIKSDQ